MCSIIYLIKKKTCPKQTINLIIEKRLYFKNFGLNETEMSIIFFFRKTQRPLFKSNEQLLS